MQAFISSNSFYVRAECLLKKGCLLTYDENFLHHSLDILALTPGKEQGPLKNVFEWFVSVGFKEHYARKYLSLLEGHINK